MKSRRLALSSKETPSSQKKEKKKQIKKQNSQNSHWLKKHLKAKQKMQSNLESL